MLSYNLKRAGNLGHLAGRHKAKAQLPLTRVRQIALSWQNSVDFAGTLYAACP
jgi:hypothetical protein